MRKYQFWSTGMFDKFHLLRCFMRCHTFGIVLLLGTACAQYCTSTYSTCMTIDSAVTQCLTSKCPTTRDWRTIQYQLNTSVLLDQNRKYQLIPLLINCPTLLLETVYKLLWHQPCLSQLQKLLIILADLESFSLWLNIKLLPHCLWHVKILQGRLFLISNCLNGQVVTPQTFNKEKHNIFLHQLRRKTEKPKFTNHPEIDLQVAENSSDQHSSYWTLAHFPVLWNCKVL